MMITDHLDKTEIMPDTIGQFTGKVDFCWAEIYEGDLVRIDGDKPQQVKWEEEYCKWITEQEDGSVEDLGDYSPEHYEIVGNIYDNPEMFHLEED